MGADTHYICTYPTQKLYEMELCRGYNYKVLLIPSVTISRFPTSLIKARLALSPMGEDVDGGGSAQ